MDSTTAEKLTQLIERLERIRDEVSDLLIARDETPTTADRFELETGTAYSILGEGAKRLIRARNVATQGKP